MIFQRYLGRSIVQSTTFVLVGFLSMFLFFDFLAELDEVGSGGYKLQQVTAVDQFKWSSHVEIAALFSRQAIPRLA